MSLNRGSWGRSYKSIWNLVLCLDFYILRRKESGMLLKELTLLIKKPVCTFRSRRLS